MSTKSINILIVDDEPDILEIIEEYLEFIVSQTHVPNFFRATNGLEGVEKAKSSKIDLVFTDFKMPHLSGLDFFNELEKVYPDSSNRPPIVFVSGYLDQVDDVVNLKTKGNVFFLNKPIQLDTLESMVNILIETLN